MYRSINYSFPRRRTVSELVTSHLSSNGMILTTLNVVTALNTMGFLTIPPVSEREIIADLEEEALERPVECLHCEWRGTRRDLIDGLSRESDEAGCPNDREDICPKCRSAAWEEVY